MLDTLKTLCYLSGVSGAEDEVRDYILERVMPHADELASDAMGNLIVFKKGAKTPERRLMLCAHMDEVGLIVTGCTDEGYLRFDCVGGIDRRVLIGKRVYVGPDRVDGVIALKAYHLVDEKEEKTVPKLDSLYIDIGCTSREQAQQAAAPGDRAVFYDSVVEFGDGFLKAKAIDDRVGCAAMVKLIESELPCDTYFAFTTQEEVGTRGARTAAFSVRPDVTLVLETTTATDIPDLAENKVICHVGDGVVIPFMDRGTVYDRKLCAALTRIADENGIKHQTKRRISGGTDASAIQRSCAGVRTAAVSCAVRSIHSPAEVGKISEFEDLLKLAGLFIGEFAEGKID